MRLGSAVRLLGCSTLLALAEPAQAQFDAEHDHLTCYRIKGKRITTTAFADNQFGREQLVELTPALLCVPSQKTVTPPGIDPLPPKAVRHFKCYKFRSVKGATLPTVQLTDQFGTEVVRVKGRRLFCTPVVKEIVGSTTTTMATTTTVTTSTTLPVVLCDGGCGGTCPPDHVCTQTQVTGTVDPFSCGCFPTGVTPCGLSAFPQCGGACLGGRICKPHRLFGSLGELLFEGCLRGLSGPCSSGFPACGEGSECPVDRPVCAMSS